jgi:chromosome partitioning protein
MRFAVASSKGGSAKSTTAVHLAAALTNALALAPRAGSVLLVDSDPNASALAWAARGPDRLPFPVVALDDPWPAHDHLVVDVAAREEHADLIELARASDRVVVPVVPSALDIHVSLATVKLLAPVADTRVLLVRCPPAPQRDAEEAREFLVAQGARVLTTTVPQRKGYALAALEGVTVRDVRGHGDLWAAWPRILTEVMA